MLNNIQINNSTLPLLFFTARSCEISSGERFECGNNVKKEEKCPRICCFDQTAYPSCYFKKKGTEDLKSTIKLYGKFSKFIVGMHSLM